MEIFKPKMYQKDLFDIDYNKLKKKGYKLLIFDLDNTLASPKDLVCPRKVKEFLTKLMTNFIVVVSSNSRKKRVSKFLEKTSIDYVYFSLKPTLRCIRKIHKKYKIDYQNMVIIGDQVMTDIITGNRKGLLTILVDPLTEDLKITSLNRKNPWLNINQIVIPITKAKSTYLYFLDNSINFISSE